MKALLENSDLSVAPNKLDQKEEKADVIYRLKCTDYLRREFDIPEEWNTLALTFQGNKKSWNQNTSFHVP